MSPPCFVQKAIWSVEKVILYHPTPTPPPPPSFVWETREDSNFIASCICMWNVLLHQQELRLYHTATLLLGLLPSPPPSSPYVLPYFHLSPPQIPPLHLIQALRNTL
jgi:hypothetical protein